LFYTIWTILFYTISTILFYTIWTIFFYTISTILFYTISTILFYTISTILFYTISSVLLYTISMVLLRTKPIKYHTAGTVPKSNRKICKILAWCKHLIKRWRGLAGMMNKCVWFVIRTISSTWFLNISPRVLFC
jgi:hypothetical protein